CSPLATIYSDQALTVPIVQPFADDGRGNTTFYAAAGNYWIAYSASGLNPVPMNYLTLLPSMPGYQFADQFPGTDASVKVNACIAKVIANGGGKCDYSGLFGAQIIDTVRSVGKRAHVHVAVHIR